MSLRVNRCDHVPELVACEKCNQILPKKVGASHRQWISEDTTLFSDPNETHADAVFQTLNSVFELTEFRPMQKEIINAAYSQNGVLVNHSALAISSHAHHCHFQPSSGCSSVLPVANVQLIDVAMQMSWW